MNLLKRLSKERLAIIPLFIIVMVVIIGVFGQNIAPNDPNKVNMALKYASASQIFPLGNDYLGRCILSRMIYAIKPSLIYVILTMIATVGIGCIVGVIAGYFQNTLDEILMRICDILLSFPSEAMVLASAGIFGIGLKTMLMTIIFLRWPWYAKIIRTAVLKYRNKNYVYYMKAIGHTDLRIIFTQIIPSIIPDIAVVATNNINSLILMMSGFSFLGLGIQAPSAEWGMMLSEAKKVVLTHPEQLIAPSSAIVLICVCFAFLGDALRDAADVRRNVDDF